VRATSDTGGSSGAGDDAARLEAENAKLKEELERTRSGARAVRMRKVRAVSTVVLAVLTSVSVFAATVATWTKRTVSDSDRFVALVAPLASDPAVLDALATKLTDQVFVALDVQGRVEDTLSAIPNLPAQATLLAGPITAAAHDLVHTKVVAFLGSQAFRDVWTELTRQLHVKVQALLNGDYDQLPNVTVDGGEVRLNLVSVVAQVVQQVAQTGVDSLGIDVTVPAIPPDLDANEAVQRLSGALGVSLPPEFGQITIMSADELHGYQQTVQQLKRLYGALLLLTFLLLAATILVAPNRRKALIGVGIGSAVGLVLGGVFLRRVEAAIADALTGPGARAAAKSVFVEVTSGLRHLGLWVVAAAVIVAIVAYLVGRPAWFERSMAWRRRVTAPGPDGSELQLWVAAHADPVRVAGVLVALVLLFLMGIEWLPVVFVGALLGLLLWWVAATVNRVHPAPEEPPPA
jgi:hypothetical protein